MLQKAGKLRVRIATVSRVATSATPANFLVAVLGLARRQPLPTTGNQVACLAQAEAKIDHMAALHLGPYYHPTLRRE